MTDPTRWADAGDEATSLEQSLVRAGQGMQMPAEDKNVLWIRILSTIPPVAVHPSPATLFHAAGSGAAAPGAAINVPSTLKILSLVVAMMGAGAVANQVGWWVATNQNFDSGALVKVSSATFESAARASVAANPVASESLIASTSVTEAAADSARVESASSAASNGPPQVEPRATAFAQSATSASAAVSQLKEESQAVLAARRALRAGDAATGLRILEKAQQRFGVGALSEEREALWIEALARSGDAARASKRAKAFLSSHPRSPHTADVQRYVSP